MLVCCWKSLRKTEKFKPVNMRKCVGQVGVGCWLLDVGCCVVGCGWWFGKWVESPARSPGVKLSLYFSSRASGAVIDMAFSPTTQKYL